MQAVTRVNAEQASKTLTQEPTRHEIGEGRSWWNCYERIRFHRSCRGSGDGMQAKGSIHNTGSPSGDRSVDQLAARERQAGRYGMAERLAVPMKPGNSGGGKEPQLKADARSDEGREIGDEPDNSRCDSRSCRRRHMQWLWRLRESSPRAGCGKSARPVR
jgi:hypothetical protein